MKKSLTLKSMISIIACVAMVLLAGFTLAACCGEETNDNVTLTSTEKVVDFGGRTDWKNSDATVLTYLGDNNYEVSGEVATMSAEQGTAWGGIAEGSKYVILSIKMEVGSTILSGWRESADDTFAEGEGKDGDYDGVEGVKEYVLGLTNGKTALHADAPVWRIEVTSPVEEGSDETPTTVVYTIDFSAIYA